MTEMTVVIAALGSALAAATSSVLQHRSARQAPPGRRPHHLIGHLVTRPLWISGLAAAAVGLVLHAVALAHGQLVLVQPLLVSGVLFALPLSALIEHRRPSGTEWLWALILVGGLAGFLLAARPTPGQVGLDADVLAWSTTISLGCIAVIVLIALRWDHGHAPALLGLASGFGYGVDAALLKQTTTVAQLGIVHLLSDWPLYIFVAVGGATVALTQMAYQSGPLAHSMPALTISDPAASVALGALAFQERLASDPLSIVAEIAGFLVMAAAAIQLARRTKTDEGDRPIQVQFPL